MERQWRTKLYMEDSPTRKRSIDDTHIQSDTTNARSRTSGNTTRNDDLRRATDLWYFQSLSRVARDRRLRCCYVHIASSVMPIVGRSGMLLWSPTYDAVVHIWRRSSRTECIRPRTGLSDKLLCATSTQRHMRSDERNLPYLPWHRLSTFGRRAFAIAGTTAWNSLPDPVRNPNLTEAFQAFVRRSCSQVSNSI